MKRISPRIAILLAFVLVYANTLVYGKSIDEIPDVPTNFDVMNITDDEIGIEFDISQNPRTAGADIYMQNVCPEVTTTKDIKVTPVQIMVEESSGITTAKSIKVTPGQIMVADEIGVKFDTGQNLITTSANIYVQNMYTGVTTVKSITVTPGQITVQDEIENLSENTTYRLWVTAMNENGESNESNVFEVTTLAKVERPLEPIGFKVENVKTTTAQVKFYVDQYVQTTGANVYIQEFGGENTYVEHIALNDNQVEIVYGLDNLKPNTEYKVWATAINKNGESDISTTFIINTKELPKAPLGFNVSSMTPVSMEVEFYVAQNPVTTSANIYVAEFVDGTWIESMENIVLEQGQRIVRHEIDNLMSNTIYKVWAKAVNDAGESEVSTTVITTTP